MACAVCRVCGWSFILLLRFIHRHPVHQEQRFFMPKRTFQPNRRHRSKTHGFLTRMKTKAGRAVISRRRAKGRKGVSVKPGFREEGYSSGEKWGGVAAWTLAIRG